MENHSTGKHDSTPSDSRAAVLDYLTTRPGFIISPTLEHQAVVLGGTRVNAHEAQLISLGKVGRAPVRAIVEPEQ